MSKLWRTHRTGDFRRELTTLLLVLLPTVSLATTIWVDPDGADSNDGSAERPVNTIQMAINRAQPGDEVFINPGIYRESLVSVRGGSPDLPIVISGSTPGKVTVSNGSNNVLELKHPYLVIENIVFDGQFARHDVVRVRSTADNLLFRFNRVVNSRKDGMDLGNSATHVGDGFDYLENVRIEDSTLQNFLALDLLGNRIDAHGIVAGGVTGLVIARTEISMVSGDALQLANGNWDDIRIVEVDFHNGPVNAELAARSGFVLGVNPGENAIDTKQDVRLPVRSKLSIENSRFRGWSGDLITNAAALNLKEKVAVTIEASTFYDNYIALRLRGAGSSDNGAHVSITNSVLYGNDIAMRVEDRIRNLEIYHNTFGLDNAEILRTAGGGIGGGFAAINNLFVEHPVPTQFIGGANLSVEAGDFVAAERADYRVLARCPGVDAGIVLPQVSADHLAVLRPQGAGYDIGAHEYSPKVVEAPLGHSFRVALAGIAALSSLAALSKIAR